MSLLGLIFTGFIFWLLFVVVRVGWRVYRTYRSMHKAFRQSPFGTQSHEQTEKSDSSWFTWGKRQSASRRRNKKIIPEDYGEYVDFTETKESTDTSSTQEFKQSDNYRESQVEDAEWEDIK